MYNNIGIYDSQVILSVFEAVAWVAVVAVLLMLLLKAVGKFATKKIKYGVWVVFTVWAIASVSLVGMYTYSYFLDSRPGMNQSFENQDL